MKGEKVLHAWRSLGYLHDLFSEPRYSLANSKGRPSHSRLRSSPGLRVPPTSVAIVTGRPLRCPRDTARAWRPHRRTGRKQELARVQSRADSGVCADLSSASGASSPIDPPKRNLRLWLTRFQNLSVLPHEKRLGFSLPFPPFFRSLLALTSAFERSSQDQAEPSIDTSLRAM